VTTECERAFLPLSTTYNISLEELWELMSIVVIQFTPLFDEGRSFGEGGTNINANSCNGMNPVNTRKGSTLQRILEIIQIIGWLCFVSAPA